MFHKLENFFQRHIEGFFDKTLGSSIQPVAIAKQLVRQMEQEASVGVAHIYVPNCYTVSLAPEDFNRLAAYKQTLEEELAEHLQQETTKKGLTIVGRPCVSLEQDETVKNGQMQICSHFQEEPGVTPLMTENEEFSSTQVFQNLQTTPLLRQRLRREGTLTVVEGADAGRQIDLSVYRVNIGRRESNELPLTDMNTSRLHAYILFEEGSHVLYDAKSLNGTYVNHHRITCKRLQNGDRIKVGNTVLIYAVKRHD